MEKGVEDCASGCELQSDVRNAGEKFDLRVDCAVGLCMCMCM